MSNLSRLPGPFTDVWDWQRHGACRGRDSAQFFHPDGERGASRARREVAAKAVCRACPVRSECALHALAAREPYGVWGGFTESERLRLLAIGWEDLADHVRGRVDVIRLEVRLGLRRPGPVALAPVQRLAPSRGTPLVRGAPPTRDTAPTRGLPPRTAPSGQAGLRPR
jgi:WhiB family redox-sensing transcriptional regulator